MTPKVSCSREHHSTHNTTRLADIQLVINSKHWVNFHRPVDSLLAHQSWVLGKWENNGNTLRWKLHFLSHSVRLQFVESRRHVKIEKRFPITLRRKMSMSQCHVATIYRQKWAQSSAAWKRESNAHSKEFPISPPHHAHQAYRLIKFRFSSLIRKHVFFSFPNAIFHNCRQSTFTRETLTKVVCAGEKWMRKW